VQTKHIHLELPPHRRHIHLFHRSHLAVAGVVHQDVHPAKAIQGLLGQRLHLGCIGHVGGHHQRFCPLLLHQVLDVL
jgi:hypothetical protein